VWVVLTQSPGVTMMGGGSGVSVFVGRRRGGLATGTPFVMSTLSLLVIVEQCSVLEFTTKGVVDVLV
jgi:hypothetical protein